MNHERGSYECQQGEDNDQPELCTPRHRSRQAGHRKLMVWAVNQGLPPRTIRKQPIGRSFKYVA